MDKKKAVVQLKIDVLRIRAEDLLKSINKQMNEYESILTKIDHLTGDHLTEDKSNAWDGLLDDGDHMGIRNRMNRARSNLLN